MDLKILMKICAILKKKIILNKINEILINTSEEDYLTLDDINGNQKLITYSQIKIINNKLKKN